MKIKNYTSTVSVNKSMSEIRDKLRLYGVSTISEFYNEKKQIDGFIFQLNGMMIRLPVKIDAIYKTLQKYVKHPRKNTMIKIYEQAERTAWKLLSDWIAIQLSMVELEQAEIIEVFMPYLWSGKQSLYEIAKNTNFKMLEYKENKQ